MKVTAPVGVPLPGATALTVAVKVTDSPKTEGLADEVTLLVVAAWLTVWVRGWRCREEVAVAAVETVIVCGPAASHGRPERRLAAAECGGAQSIRSHPGT